MTRALIATLLVLGGCRIERRDAEAPQAYTPQADTPQPDTPHALAEAPLSEAAPPAPPRTAPVETPSGLVVPVIGVQPADLVDTYDDARSEGRVHDALDIPAPRGMPVVAAHAGTLARLFTSARGGLTVYVRDGRTVYYYAHLDATAPGLAAGQAVARGAWLGAVGSTGNASPEASHLHFAIWTAADTSRFWDGEALNPYPLLTGRPGVGLRAGPEAIRPDSASSPPARPHGR